MNKLQMERWEQARAKGKKNFVLMNGVLGWGLPVAFLYTSLMTYLDYKKIEFNDEFFELLVISVILFPIGGILFGLWVWHWTERNYRRAAGIDSKE